MKKPVWFPQCGHEGEKVRVLVEVTGGDVKAKDICLACVGKFFGIVRAQFEKDAATANQLHFDLEG